MTYKEQETSYHEKECTILDKILNIPRTQKSLLLIRQKKTFFKCYRTHVM